MITQPIDTKARNKGRRTLILIVLLFAVPVIAAQWLYWFGDDYREKATVNRGDLISPARPWGDRSLQRLDKKGVVSLRELEQFWTLVTINSSDCDVVCEKNLYKIRQSRLAMGGDKDRVQRLMILTDTSKLDKLKPVLESHQGMMLATGDARQLAGIDTLFSLKDQPAASVAQHIYLLDPFGNLMMSYKADANPKDIVKDMELLLKVNRL